MLVVWNWKVAPLSMPHWKCMVTVHLFVAQRAVAPVIPQYRHFFFLARFIWLIISEP